MRLNLANLAILVPILAVRLHGEVTESTVTGFLVRNTTTINATPATVYGALTDKVGGWWDPAHNSPG
jgi:hypothetical protein